jgi:hypothetical protein
MLSEPAPEDWSVLVTTSDGTALAPGDYLAVAERVLIPAGGREVAVPIEVVADRVEITICDGSPPHCGAG